MDTADGFWTRTTSPSGAHVWIVDAWEPRMSLWVMAGALHATSPSAVLFTPPPDWSFEERDWSSNDRLRLVGRRYPGNLRSIVLTLDVTTLTGTIEGEGLAEVLAPPSGPQPFEVLLRWLDAFGK